MTFSNSLELLSFHWVVYTIYAFMIISIVAWFGYNLGRKEKVKSIVRIPFYGYMAFLVIMGVGHHIFTYNTIPWVSQDITRHNTKPDARYEIEVGDHKWRLPKIPIQMQVDPGHNNDIYWTFNHNGDFDLTSTEYSGPAQYNEEGEDIMLVKHFMKVVGCEKGGKQ